MARPAKFSTDQILDAACEAGRDRWRDVSIADVAYKASAPVGSIYHRFASRDALLGALWVRSIHRFHAGLLTASTLTDPQEAMAALLDTSLGSVAPIPATPRP